MSVLLSTTTRFGGVIGKDASELALREAARRRQAGDPVAKLLELVDVESSQPVEFLRGEEHCHVAFLATDDNGLALRRVEEGGEALFGIRSGYVADSRILARFRQNVHFPSGHASRLNPTASTGVRVS